MKIIMLIGKPNCGKTTTCRLLYQELESWSSIRKSTYNKEGGDFSCSLNFNHKDIFIKSAGDSRKRIHDALEKRCNIVICTCRANFTDVIDYARQICNGNLFEVNKEVIGNQEAKNMIIDILKNIENY
ncbi:MAG: AAA family ATPase [Mariniphaga sp.]